MSTAEIIFDNTSVTVRCGRLVASLPPGTKIRFATFGCRLLGCLRRPEKDKPPIVPPGSSLDVLWTRKLGKRWMKIDDATGKLARGFLAAADSAGAGGLILYDTMRKGSDFWRPGKLLTDAADAAQSIAPGISVSYAREDGICPPRNLLDTFRTSEMSFGQYAREYAEYLHRGSPAPVHLAAAAAIVAQAQGLLAAFYCTDPHIPAYGDPEEIASGTPYEKRHWLDVEESSLRDPGCHRVILAEEMGRYFSRQGVRSEVIEIDQSLDRNVRRIFATLDD